MREINKQNHINIIDRSDSLSQSATPEMCVCVVVVIWIIYLCEEF